jgi:hypothetical protein
MQPRRRTSQDGIFELFDSLDGELVAWLARNPKSIISGAASSRYERIYAQVPAAEFCGIWDHATSEATLRAPSLRL